LFCNGAHPRTATPLVSALALFLTATILMLFFNLQAGAFYALTLGREALTVGEIIQAGKAVFAGFVWLTLKAGLLFALVINVLVLPPSWRCWCLFLRW
jgi:hypothetical protein